MRQFEARRGVKAGWKGDALVLLDTQFVPRGEVPAPALLHHPSVPLPTTTAQLETAGEQISPPAV